MKTTAKALARQHITIILEMKRSRESMQKIRKEVMKMSSNWAARATASVDFLETEEEIQLYYGALVASEKKMRNYK